MHALPGDVSEQTAIDGVSRRRNVGVEQQTEGRQDAVAPAGEARHDGSDGHHADDRGEQCARLVVGAAMPGEVGGFRSKQKPQAEADERGEHAIEVGGLTGVEEQNEHAGQRQDSEAAAPEWPGETAGRRDAARDRSERIQRPQLADVLRPQFTAGDPEPLHEDAKQRTDDRRDQEHQHGAHGAEQSFSETQHHNGGHECDEEFEHAVGEKDVAEQRPPLAEFDDRLVAGAEQKA